MVKRFEVWNVELNPTVGSEINKLRPCVVLSPDVVNNHLNTVVIIPLTSTIRPYPTRVDCHFGGKAGQVAIDQLRSVDKTRLKNKLGSMDKPTSRLICSVMCEFFKY